MNAPFSTHLIVCTCGKNNILLHASCVPSSSSIYGYVSQFVLDGDGKLDHFDYVHCAKCGARHSVKKFIQSFHRKSVKFAKQNISLRLG